MQDIVQNKSASIGQNVEEIEQTRSEGRLSISGHIREHKINKLTDDNTPEISQQFSRINRKKKFLIDNTEQVMAELHRLI